MRSVHVSAIASFVGMTKGRGMRQTRDGRADEIPVFFTRWLRLSRILKPAVPKKLAITTFLPPEEPQTSPHGRFPVSMGSWTCSHLHAESGRLVADSPAKSGGNHAGQTHEGRKQEREVDVIGQPEKATARYHGAQRLAKGATEGENGACLRAHVPWYEHERDGVVWCLEKTVA